MSSKLIALIPARQGSKRIPGKNVRMFCGYPLIAYTIASACQSGVFQKVVVSTNDEKTADIARNYGAETPFIRPEEYAGDTSPDIEWVQHALQSLDDEYDYFSILRRQTPFGSLKPYSELGMRFRKIQEQTRSERCNRARSTLTRCGVLFRDCCSHFSLFLQIR